MKPYRQIFPGAQAPNMILVVPQKSGRLPQGSYTFLECFCTRPACDCRRVILLVLDERMRHRAQIHLSFDDDGPFSGPYLSPFPNQVPYAEELLDFCVHTLNSSPGWLERMQRHYREVRELIDGRPYCGKAFPGPGELFFRAMPSPDLESFLRESIRHDGRLCGARVRPDAGKALEPKRPLSDYLPPQEEGEGFLQGVLKRFAASGLTSPFEGADEMLELFAVSAPELIPGLVWELLTADQALLRDIAVLLLYNGDTELSRGVARMVTAIDGASITPQALSRLIITRNWFGDPVRGCVDEAIANARKARVACAHIPIPAEVVVLAGPVDGGGNQMFYAAAPDGPGHVGCTVSLKEGGGVAECAVSRLSSRTERDAFLAAVRDHGSCLDSDPAYFGLRMAHALAQGNEQGRAPGHWLVRVAEALGCTRWQASPLDVAQALKHMHDDIARNAPLLLEPAEQLASLDESGQWHRYHAIFGTWREEGSAVARVTGVVGHGGKREAAAVIERLCDQVLEQNRQILLARLVVQALWLKSSPLAPISWQRVYHVAQAMADPSIALKEIPLAVSVAKQTLKAYRARTAPRGGAEGEPA